MTRSVVAELKTLQDIYNNDANNLDYLTDSYKNIMRSILQKKVGRQIKY